MHGRVQRHSESCRSLRRCNSQPMRSLLPSSPTVAVANSRSPRVSSIKASESGDSFFKDGRKISVGDCALFKPPQDSPPFIGLVRTLALKEENNLQLGVNWLYRASDLKLDKSPLVDSAPNEIFYSFHKDKIPAASLLHPCKVAFLPRGVELPSGTSSFICRRAYDIANQCLWWLTDRDYINEQQQEVDQLLNKTRTEMHVSLQPGGRSPKQANGSTSISQLKPASDSGQNSGTSVHSQNKGKKRERSDHGNGAHPVKRDRSSSRTDDGDSVQCKTESNLKSEIARITEKGRVVDAGGVEKLVQLMQQDKKIDLLSRTMLVNVMASTDKIDCLNRFVQLRGLPILDEWLQDIHKGKIGDLKSGDRSVEEFLLVLLRALDKLPVNLQALQMCNIGKSVNHLRSHKNVEIHRKARTLVDTWKKRVEAEMISIDAKNGSTQAAAASSPSKSRLPEPSHGGCITPNGSDVATKSSISQNSAAKTASVRFGHGENYTKYATLSPVSVKPATSIPSGKECQPGNSVGGTADAPQIREDRSSSSNQSHNYGQSSSAKEDVKSPNSGSVSVSKTSINTRNRKSSGFSGILAKETNSSKVSIANKSSASEKLSHSALTNERVVEGPTGERSGHKLIVKIPNRVTGGSVEDPTSTSSRASSPVLSNKHGQSDHALKDKSDAYQCKVASGVNALQNNVQKDVLNSPAILPDEEQSMTTEDSKRIMDGLPVDQLKSFKLHASSFSPMNALIESCAKYSETTSSLSLEDDVGMNLLASVAAGEMSRSDAVSPTDSTERSTDEAKSKSAPEESECDGKKQALLNGCLGPDTGLHLSKQASLQSSSDGKCVASRSFEDMAIEEGIKDLGSSSANSKSNADRKLETNATPNEKTDISSSASPTSTEKARDVELNEGIHMENATSNNVADVMLAEKKDSTHNLSTDECKPMVEDAGSKPMDEGNCNKIVDDKVNRTSSSEQKLSAAVVKSEFSETANCENKLGVLDVGDANHCLSKCESLKFDKEVDKNAAGESQTAPVVSSTSHDLNSRLVEAKVENQEIAVHTPQTESTCPDSGAKLGFDLNEHFSADDGKYRESATSTSSASTTVNVINSLPFSAHSIASGHSNSVTITAAAKGPFVPPGDLLRSRVELGWKGSAATSAFRPAEPRKVIETPTNSSSPDVSTRKHDRIPLDIDLNVPDERVVAEMASRGSALAVDSTTDSVSTLHAHSGGGLDLDLNRVDEANDMGNCSTSGNHGNLQVRRDFDLNDGPVVDDAGSEQFPFINQLAKSGITSQLPSSGLRMNSPVLGSLSSWYPAYSTVAIPSILPDRGEQPFSVYPTGPQQRTFVPAGVSPYNPDVYRGSVLSSSPAVPYPSSHFHLPVFPYPSATFSVGADSSSVRPFAPPMNTQYVGPVGSQFQRPYLVSLPGISSNGVLESNRQWVRQGLDLNTGPAAMESEVREMLPLSSGQHTIVSSQVLTEEQARMFSVSGGLLKRQEPDGGWDSETFRRKQSSWQ